MFSSETIPAVFTSGSGNCQAANEIKGSEATGYAGLRLDSLRVLMSLPLITHKNYDTQKLR
jgi:hypothetical protein